MDVLQLSTKAAADLLKLNDLMIEDDGMDKVKNMCKYIMQLVTVGKSNIIIDESDDAMVTAISIIIFEAAKAQASSEQFKASLSENNIAEEVAALLHALYDRQRDAFIQHLAQAGISMPELVGVEWRLDYVVRSKHGGRENYPLFLISLKVKDRGLVRYVDFTATHEELQDLLEKVRDGVKQVDRLLHVAKDK